MSSVIIPCSLTAPTHTHTQIREMLTATISHYVDLFGESNLSYLPQFKLQLCLESGQMEFYPSLSDLESTLLATVHTVANAMTNVPNIQVRLSIQHCQSVLNLFCSLLLLQHWLSGAHPVPPIVIGVDRAVVEGSCAQIKRDLERYLQAPLEHLKSYGMHTEYMHVYLNYLFPLSLSLSLSLPYREIQLPHLW